MRIPVAGERSLSCLASSGHPAVLSRSMVPVEGSRAGVCFSHGLTEVVHVANDQAAEEEPGGTDEDEQAGITSELGHDVEVEIVTRVLAELPEPVTIVSEPLIGSGGPLGVLSLAFAAQPEPSEPELRFLSTLAGLTAQALERAQVFEHEREALRAAEAGRERLSILSEVTRLLSSSLEPTTVIRRTMSLVEGRLADSCMVQVPARDGSGATRHARHTAGGAGGRSRRLGPGGRALLVRRSSGNRVPYGAHPAGSARARGEGVEATAGDGVTQV